MTMHVRLAGLLATVWLGGCVLDSLGYESDVTQRSQKLQQEKLEDDRIQDKHPVLDPALTVQESFGSCTFTLNKSGSVTKLGVAPYEGDQKSLAGRLFANRGAALAALQAMPDTDVIPSMETVNGHLKPFNDGLYAAVELAMQDGVAGGFGGKRKLLADILSALQVARQSAAPAAQSVLDGAAAFVGAALLLAGATPALPAPVLADAQARAAKFQTPSVDSKPIGFYTWTPSLQAIFTQDRFLQWQGTFADLAGIALVLQGDASLRQAYETVVALYAGLTNPYVSYTVSALLPGVPSASALEDVPGMQQAFAAQHPAMPWACAYPRVAFLPASRSKDTSYFNALSQCDFNQFAGTNVMDVLIAGIRSGALDLTPTADSGWYDYQLYALETLLVPERGPESDHLLLTAAYKQKLIDTFKTLITETRDTHVKQVGMASAGSSSEQVPVDLYPKLPVEPFPTFYLRTARAYRFLDTFLRATLGSAFLDGLARVREDGSSSSLALTSELAQTTQLAYGLHAVACASLGLRPESYLLGDEAAALDQTAARTRAGKWLAEWRTDPDVLADPRVIVPVGTLDSGTRYWATIGVKPLKISAEFVAGYEPQVVGGCTVKAIVPHRYDLLVEDTVEIVGTSTPPPTRAELRRICDDKVTHDAIVAALQAR